MGWHREVAEADLDDLVARHHGHEQFVASQWQSACRHYLDLCERMGRERAVRDWLEQAGRLVVAAKYAGRKTARIDQILVEAGIPGDVAEQLAEAGHPVDGAPGGE